MLFQAAFSCEKQPENIQSFKIKIGQGESCVHLVHKGADKEAAFFILNDYGRQKQPENAYNPIFRLLFCLYSAM